MANEEVNAQPAFAEVIRVKKLPNDIEAKINTEYEAGKSYYSVKARFVSKIANEKVAKISIGAENFFGVTRVDASYKRFG